MYILANITISNFETCFFLKRQTKRKERICLQKIDNYSSVIRNRVALSCSKYNYTAEQNKISASPLYFRISFHKV